MGINGSPRADPDRQLNGALAGGGTGDYVLERTEWVRVQRELAEMRRDQKRGELVPAEVIVRICVAAVNEIKNKTFAVPDRIASQLLNRSSAGETARIMHEGLSDAWSEITDEGLVEAMLRGCEDADDGSGSPST